MSAPTGAARFGAAAAKRLPTPPQPVTAPQRKYTVLLDAGTADDLDSDLLGLHRRTGRLVAKSDVIRELVALLHEDPALLEQVAGRLDDGMTAQRPRRLGSGALWLRDQVIGHLQQNTNRQRITMAHFYLEGAWLLTKWWQRRKGLRPYN